MATSPTRNEKPVGCAEAGTAPMKPAVQIALAINAIFKEFFIVLSQRKTLL